MDHEMQGTETASVACLGSCKAVHETCVTDAGVKDFSWDKCAAPCRETKTTCLKTCGGKTGEALSVCRRSCDVPYGQCKVGCRAKLQAALTCVKEVWAPCRDRCKPCASTCHQKQAQCLEGAGVTGFELLSCSQTCREAKRTCDASCADLPGQEGRTCHLACKGSFTACSGSCSAKHAQKQKCQDEVFKPCHAVACGSGGSKQAAATVLGAVKPPLAAAVVLPASTGS